MIVCSCLDVGARQVAATIAAGARDEEQVGDRCGAGTRCGSCLPTLRALLEEHERTRPVTAGSAAA